MTSTLRPPCSCVKGADPSSSGDGTPFGYNVHLPYGEVKAIITDVYGGENKADRLKQMNYPGSLDELLKDLPVLKNF